MNKDTANKTNHNAKHSGAESGSIRYASSHSMWKKCLVILMTVTMLLSGTSINMYAYAGIGEADSYNDVPSKSLAQDQYDAADAQSSEDDWNADAANDGNGEGYDADAAGTESGEAGAEEIAIEDEEVPMASPKETAGLENELPRTLPADSGEAVAAVAASQEGAHNSLSRYGELLGEPKADPWDAAFALFVLNGAGVLDMNRPQIPVEFDTAQWIDALDNADLLQTADSESNAPQKGDVVFFNAQSGTTQAAVVIDAEDEFLTVITSGEAENSDLVTRTEVTKKAADSFISMDTLLPQEENAEKKENSEAEKDAPAFAGAEGEAADKGAKDSEKPQQADKQDSEPAAEENDAQEQLIQQAVEADLIAGPGITGKVNAFFRALTGADKNTRITLNGMMPEGAVVKAYPVSVEIPGQEIISAYDITIYAPAGEELVEWQPVEPVSVKISNDDITAVRQDANLNVFHMEDEDASAEQISGVAAGNSEVSFDAEKFSIYIVSQDTPSKVYTFINGSDIYSKQVLEDGDTLIKPESPSKDGAVFSHWSLTENGEAFEDFDTPVSVSEDDQEDVILYAVYGSDSIYITYYDQNGAIADRQAVVKPAEGEDAVTVDTTEENYTPLQDRDGVYLQFCYWTKNLSARTPVDAGVLEITSESKDIDLYPVVREGHWIYFNANKEALEKGCSVSYCAPLFVVSGDENAEIKANVPVSAGYEFLGWYTRKNGGEQVFDAEGNKVYDEQNPTAGYGKLLNEGGAMTNDPTVYAHWRQSTTSYSVVYYAQKASDPANAALNEKTYDFVKVARVVDDAKAGDTVSYDPAMDTTEAAFGKNTDNSKGFVLSNNTKSVKVKGDGSTVLHVYFDRKAFTLSFRDCDNEAYTNGTATYEIDIPDDQIKKKNKNSDKLAYPELYTITALYGADISAKFPIPGEGHGYYQTSSTGDRIDNGKSFSLAEVSWRDADKSSSSISGKFKRLDVMPLLAKQTEYLSHNHFVASHGDEQMRAVYYKEVPAGTDVAGLDLNDQVSDDVRVPRYVKLENPQTHKDVYYQYYYAVAHGWADLKYADFFKNLEGFKQGVSDPAYMKDGVVSKDADAKASVANISNNTINEVYHQYAKHYYDRKDYTVTLIDKDDVDNRDRSYEVSFKYDEPITEEKLGEFDPIPNLVRIDSEHYWYYDEACTDPVDFNDLRMRDVDGGMTLYAGLKYRYLIKIDPNGGELFGEGGEKNDYSTWFRVNRGEDLVEYANISRDYTLAREGEEATHSYVNNQYDADDESKERTATYVETSDNPEYIHNPGAYTLIGWFSVDDDGSVASQPYNFKSEVNSPLTLRAMWRRAGTFTVKYDAGEGVRAPKDTMKYADGAHVIAAASVDAPENQVFDHWETSDGASYSPNELVKISEDIASEKEDGNFEVTLTACYREADTADLAMADYVFMANDRVHYTQTIAEGERLTAPPTPVSDDGKAFVGWYLDSACKKPFEGFGIVNNPANTVLYAGFADRLEVSYYMVDENGNRTDRILTTQMYTPEDILNTMYVDYPVDNDHEVAYWTDQDGNRYGYKTANTNQAVDKDLQLWPVLSPARLLRFDSRGGSYVEPVKIPVTGWPSRPAEPVRDGFVFKGWYTSSACNEEEEYDFDQAIPEGVTTLYAGWEVDTRNPKTGQYNVIWWVQTPDRPEDDANDTDHYEMLMNLSETGVYGEYSTADLLSNYEQKGFHATNLKAMTDYGVNKGVQTAISFSDRMGGTNDLAKYFEFNEDKSDQQLVIDDSGNCVLNLRFDLKEYWLAFDTRVEGRGTSRATIRFNNEAKTGDQYKIKVWLNRDIRDLWPMPNEDRVGDPTKAYLSVNNGFRFNGWLAGSNREGNTLTYVTLQPNADKEKIDMAAAANSGTYTYTITETTKRTPATIHYYFKDLNGNFQEDEGYLQENYYINTSSVTEDSNLRKDNVYYQYLSGFTSKAIDGYKVITTPNDSWEFNKEKNSDEGYARYISTNGGRSLNFYYSRNTYTLNLYANESSKIDSLNVPYETVLYGENGLLQQYVPQAPGEDVEFDCWSVSPSFSSEYEGTMPASSLTLYARWKTKTVTVTTEGIDADGNETNDESAYGKYQAVYGSELNAFHIAEPKKENSLFRSWYLVKENGETGTRVASTDTIKEDITIRAKWNDYESRKVRYDSNGGDGTAPADPGSYVNGASVTVLGGSELTLQRQDMNQNEYTARFAYWNTEEDGTGKTYYPGEVMIVDDEDAAEVDGVMTITLYAQYDQYRETSMVYNKNANDAAFHAKTEGEDLCLEDDGTIRIPFRDDSQAEDSVGRPNTKITVGEDKNGTAFEVTRTGYNFLGWATSPNATKADAKNGDSAYVNTLEEGGNTLYAVWERMPSYLMLSNDSKGQDITFRLTVSGGEENYNETLYQLTGDVNGELNGTIGSNDVAYYDIPVSKGCSTALYLPRATGLTYEVHPVIGGEVLEDSALNDQNLQWAASGRDGNTGTLLETALAENANAAWTKLQTIAGDYSANNGPFSWVQIEDTLGTMVVENRIEGKMGDKTRKFTYTLTVNGAAEDETFDAIVSTGDGDEKSETLSWDGEGMVWNTSFELGDNESIAITLPLYTDVTVDVDGEDYDTTVTKDSDIDGGELTNPVSLQLEKALTTLTFTNTRENVPVTGIAGVHFPYITQAILILLAGLYLIAFRIFVRRSRRFEPAVQ